ncbi:MAG TPA: ThiF family adenylyltransferase [Thermoanaerobaculia bacterium]|jgi:hypothetical protein
MSHPLLDRSADLKRLRDEGYDVEIRGGYLLLKDVPYVTPATTVARGTLVSELTLAGNVTIAPGNHVVYFVGEHPCRNDGTPISQIAHSSQRTLLAHDLQVDHAFSNKPPNGYANYYDKMTRYATIISGYAEAIDSTATAKTFPAIASGPEAESVFVYLDTASSRAGISALSEKLAGMTIAIVGLGGTGSYVLDLVAKTPVRAIHVYDRDTFSQHNAFRAPGAASLEDLAAKPQKVIYLQDRYSRMHRNIVPHDCYIDEDNVAELRIADFVFLCLDKGGPKKIIVEHLEAFGTPFIDVGMGVQRTDTSLGGIVRVTTSTATKRDHVRRRVSFGDGDANNEYDQNIQIAELNALNAALAVIKWKKLCGFYRDLDGEHDSTYTIDGNLLTNEECV